MLRQVLCASVTATVASAVGDTLPVLPLSIAAAGSWTPPLPGGRYFGDTRAVIQLPSDYTGPTAAAQIFWRRRDPNPAIKEVVVVSSATGKVLPLVNATVESTCGLVYFSAPPGAGLYWAYYLPFVQNSGGASTTFTWGGCNSTDPTEANPCVLGRRASGGGASVCSVATSAATVVTGIEGRNSFDAFTDMEMMSAPAEATAAAAALQARLLGVDWRGGGSGPAVGNLALSPTPSLSVQASGAPFVGVFPTDRDHSVRVFDVTIPVRWVADAGTAPAFAGTAHAGEDYFFQLGLWAYAGGVANLTADGGAGLVGPAGATVPLTFMNLQGVDFMGSAFNKTMTLAAGAVGSLWVGAAVPAAAAPGTYAGVVTLSAPGAVAEIHVPVSLVVDSVTVPFGGAENITSLTRLSWLYSRRGLEDTVPQPFVAVSASGGGPSGQPLTVTSHLRSTTISAAGLIENAVVSAPSFRRGVAVSPTYWLLASPMAFVLVAGGVSLSATVTVPAYITALTNSTVTWEAVSSVTVPPTNGVVTLTVSGTLDFTSFCTFAVAVSNTAGSPVSLDDIQLTYAMNATTNRFIVGMGQSGSESVNVSWNWSNTTATNKLWMGRAEAGLVVNLNGDGAAWSSPMFGADFPVVPFVPSTWGGVEALPENNPNGANATAAGVFVATSGPRTLAPTSSSPPPLVFRFDAALTPSKQVDWQRHWHTRAIQVGYGTDYISPQDVAAEGATVVTLHQGCPGIINGSLVNPYISYPFLNDTVPLLTNYTAQSNDLGMSTKFYYTIRELSSHAVETHAFLSLQGEIFLDQDPYVVVQPGYSHAWNAHGGAAHLHEHLVTHYAACWQQSLSNGEWDPSVCDIGVSRLFNYYVEGLWWSVTQPPYINGIYYDGTNFPRIGMQRIRRVADAAATRSPRQLKPLLDLHTGEDPSPPAVSYASHYPYIDYVWNGEGFDFSGSPAYWLVELSSRIHGLSGDMLGSGPGSAFRGMLFGMTERNSGTAPSLWAFWDAVHINETVSMGWWEDDLPVSVNYTCSGGSAQLDLASSLSAEDGDCPAWNVTTNGYYDGYPCGSPSGNVGCFSSLTVDQAQTNCCANPACAGFSTVPNGDGTFNGCFKRSKSCFRAVAGDAGYYKPGFVPPPDPNAAVLSTTFSAFGQYAVIVLASYCPNSATATLTLDWAALGLNSSAVVMVAPAIEGVQAAANFSNPAGPYVLPGDGGIILHLHASS